MSEAASIRESSPSKIWTFGPVVPLAATLAAVPYGLVYLKNLWEFSHYQFYPLLIAAVTYLIVQRFGGRHSGNWYLRCLRAILLAGGLFGVLCATLFASPWMGFFGFVMCLTSWLAHHRDKETGGSLVYLGVPIFLIWQPPYNSIITGDTILIQRLQSASAQLSSQWLDILGYPHFQPGTILEFAGMSFGVAEACSGIQSFFAVLSVGALLIVFLRRGLIHASLLLATSPLWAVLMNTIRITVIPVAYSSLGVDLSHGLLHDLLGYCTMGLAIGLILSTDELFLFIEKIFASVWLPNASVKAVAEPGQDSTSQPAQFGIDTTAEHSQAVGSAGAASWLILAPTCLFLAFCFGIQTYDAVESWGHQRDVVDFFRDEPLIELFARDAPDDLIGWQRVNYDQQNRERGNDDLGQRSDLWFYDAPFGRVSVSFDQMFPGWHELTRCYRNAGWKPGNRQVFRRDAGVEWPIVGVEMTRGNEHGYLLFCEINRSGTPIQPPGDFNYWTILQERLMGRLTPAVRGALFGIAVYQIQIFSSTPSSLSEDERLAMLERFQSMRETLWTAARQRL